MRNSERHEPANVSDLYIEVAPSPGALVRRVAMWVLKVTVCGTCCFAAARWGAAVERRRDDAIGRSRPHSLQGRGELWLRCPSSTTWYSYQGDPREWREEKTEEP